nr:hypothetical protein [Myxococcota bacterium]
LAALSLSACGTVGVPLDEVTNVPLALVYWDGPAARARAEVLEGLTGQGGDPKRRGVANLEAVARLVGSLPELGASQRLEAFPGRIVLLNVRTLEKESFPFAPPNARPLAWSGDHQRLLFSSDHLDEGRSQVFEYDGETGEVRKLTRGPALHPEADYGPNDEMVFSWISFVANEQRAGMKVRAIGGGEPEVLEEGGYPMGPRWASEGDLILYIAADDRPGTRDASAVVVREPLPGGKVSRLAPGRDAVFSSDGSWIIFSSQGPRGWRLQRMRPDGSGRKALGTSALSARWPAISPDGRHVAYVSNEDGIDRLYLRRIDGSGDRILLEDGAVAFPVW